jgi:hypothetical protein
LLHRLIVVVAVLAAAFIASPAPAQDGAAGLVAALPGEINFGTATTRDGGRTTDVELVLAPAEDVRFRTSDISVAFWSPDRRLVVTRVHANGGAQYTLAAGETKRGVARFTVPPGYDWHILSGSLQWQYRPLHPLALATPEPTTTPQAVPTENGVLVPGTGPPPPAAHAAKTRPDLLAARCQAGSGEGEGLSRTERFDLATCLLSGRHDAEALHAAPRTRARAR